MYQYSPSGLDQASHSALSSCQAMPALSLRRLGLPSSTCKRRVGSLHFEQSTPLCMHEAVPHASSSARGMHAGFQHCSSLEAATGKPVVNLDDWLMSQEDIMESFWRHAADADLCIVDGVAGLIDGRWDRWVPRL